jgi:hypothetical protein
MEQKKKISKYTYGLNNAVDLTYSYLQNSIANNYKSTRNFPSTYEIFFQHRLYLEIKTNLNLFQFLKSYQEYCKQVVHAYNPSTQKAEAEEL